MVLINGQKFACDSCIRGHRSSSCAHTSGRTLHLVRAKGRPASQCETCRTKRKEKGVHAKCVCGDASGGTTASPVAQGEARRKVKTMRIEQWKPSTEPALPVVEKHSLEALMNPCRCRTTGICICCKSSDGGAGGHDMDESGASASLCAGTADCCSGDGAGGGQCCGSTETVVPVASFKATKAGEGCCSGGGAGEGKVARASPASAAEAPRTVNGQDYIDSVLASAGIPPLPLSTECQCGPGCRCDGCLSHANKTSSESADSASASSVKRSPSSSSQHGADCPTRCDSCLSCDLGLLLPSGIEEVDRFMKGEGRGSSGSPQRPSVDSMVGPRKRRSARNEEGVDGGAHKRSTSAHKRQRRSPSLQSDSVPVRHDEPPTSTGASLAPFCSPHISETTTRS